MDLGPHFHDFWAPKSGVPCNMRNCEKPMFYIMKFMNSRVWDLIFGVDFGRKTHLQSDLGSEP